MHAGRLVWRFGDTSKKFKVYGFRVMTFGDKPAACGLEIAKELVVEAGEDVCAETAKIMRQGSYVDDSMGGGDLETVDKLVGQVENVNGHLSYSGTVSQILSIGGMKPKVMVRDGEQDPVVVGLLGGGVLGLPWEPGRDVIPFHIGLNISPR